MNCLSNLNMVTGVKHKILDVQWTNNLIVYEISLEFWLGSADRISKLSKEEAYFKMGTVCHEESSIRLNLIFPSQ